MKSVRLEIARKASEERVAKFYREHSAKDPVKLNGPLGDITTFCLIESDTNALFGAHCRRAIVSHEAKLYSLSGWTRLLKDGYRFRTLLNVTSALLEFTLNPPYEATSSVETYFTVVPDTDEKMTKSLFGLGFQKRSPPDDLLRELEICNEECSFYALPPPPGVLPEFARTLRSFVTTPVLQGGDRQPALALTIDIKVVKSGHIFDCFS